MTAKEIMILLESLGTAQTKKTWINHGGKEPLFGVKIEELKKIVKKVKTNHELALELYATGNSDAMYLAGLISDPMKMSKKNLQDWVNAAYWSMLSDYAVAWTAAESPFGTEMGLKWIDDKREFVAAAGWSTLAAITSVKDDSEIDTKVYKALLKRIEKEIHTERNRVRYTMNMFVIAVGCYVKELTEECKKTGEKIGKITVDMGGTACKVPEVIPYIDKVIARGSLGKKRKTAKC